MVALAKYGEELRRRTRNENVVCGVCGVSAFLAGAVNRFYRLFS